ncbi:MAG: DNA polymerase III subunit epsilon [Hyphomicrobiaceae bacterium]|nr:DNA polymerase III subunit epsilon [Hyphomicrobiaceae bacterium]
MQREIVLDTETTGLDALKGDRLIELGCIEIINRVPTGQEFHRLINPETRDVHPDAERVHGISTSSLKGKPFFRDIYQEFLDFVGDSMLVIHNAPFDIGFINMELGKVGRSALEMTRVVDTLQLARRKHPGGPNTLDALCKRYGIDISKRVKHGAIMDSLLLAEVYVELLGERQATLSLATTAKVQKSAQQPITGQGAPSTIAKPRPTSLPTRLTDLDREAHASFVKGLGDKAIWLKYEKKPT